MPPSTFHTHCVYTIREKRKLDEEYTAGSDGLFQEKQPWRSALAALEATRTSGTIFPVVFADASHIKGIIYWAHIEEITIQGRTSTIRYSNLNRFASPQPRRLLIVDTTGQPLSNSDIRPYRICRTPRFLSKAVPQSGAPELPDVDLSISATENRVVLRHHLRRERDPGLVAAKKRYSKSLACEVCGFDYADVYGDLGDGFCEVHHRNPLSSTEEVVETSLKDLAIVCANCHRMLHKPSTTISIETLRTILKNKQT
jgi:hypothetical protein